MTTTTPTPAPLSAEELDAIEARANSATEGPWAQSPGNQCIGTQSTTFGDLNVIATCNRYWDREFITAARQDVPKLIASHRSLTARVESLEALVYVPGLWKCAKCGFQLVQRNLNAANGTVTARDNPGDRCPNCDVPLWRVTERDAGNEMSDRCVEQMDRAKAAEARATQAEAERDAAQAALAAAEAREQALLSIMAKLLVPMRGADGGHLVRMSAHYEDGSQLHHGPEAYEDGWNAVRAALSGAQQAPEVTGQAQGGGIARELAEAMAGVRGYITVTRCPVFDEEITKASAVERFDAALAKARASGLLPTETREGGV